MPTFLPILDTKNQFLPVTPKPLVTTTKPPILTTKKSAPMSTDAYDIKETIDYKLDEQTTGNYVDFGMTTVDDYSMPALDNNDKTTLTDDSSYQDKTEKITFEETTLPLQKEEDARDLMPNYQDAYTTTVEEEDATYLAPREFRVKNKRGTLSYS